MNQNKERAPAMSRTTERKPDQSFPGWYITFQQDLLATAPRPGEIDKETVKAWHGKREDMRRGLKNYFCPTEAERKPAKTKQAEVTKPHREVITLDAVPAHKTTDCFRNTVGIRYWRDLNLDKWTPKGRNSHDGGEYTATRLGHPMQFRQMAGEILNITVENNDSSKDQELQKLLIEGGHCVEFLQIEKEIQNFKEEKSSFVKDDGYSTFFFVDNQDGSVSVVDVWWVAYYRLWLVFVDLFGNGSHWDPDNRFVSRNLVT